MRLEWDETKRLTNVRDHGIDFVDAIEVFEGDVVTVEDDRVTYGEQRFVTLGLLKGRVVAIVHTERGKAIRLISVRKGTKNEATTYFRQIAYGLGESGRHDR